MPFKTTLDATLGLRTLRGEFCMQYADQPAGVKRVVPDGRDRYASTVQRMQERSVPVGGGHLNCAVGPENGPPLVLFHGVTRCWRDFEPLLPDLTRSWQVWALDHRGHGRSSRGGSRYRVADFATDALVFLDQALPATAPAVLAGHSLGAMVAAVVAAERPDGVRAVVLEDPPGTTLGAGVRSSRFHLQFTNTRALLNSRESAPGDRWDGWGQGDPGRAGDVGLEALARALGDMAVQRPSDGAVVPFRELRDWDALRFSAECLRMLDPAVLDTLTSGEWLEGLDWFGLLPRIAGPTLLLRADPACGGMLEAAEAVRIGASIPRCTRVDLPGVGHSIHTAEPARMLEMIARFRERHQLFNLPTRVQT